MRASDQLTLDAIYTRNELCEKFKTTDATIKTGVFQPKGYESIWLFITEEKAPGRTQYEDELRGNRLFMDGQTAGIKDRLLIEHEARGLKIILFFRKSKSEHLGAGFRYEGRFRYIEHTGKRPAHFHFERLP